MKHGTWFLDFLVKGLQHCYCQHHSALKSKDCDVDVNTQRLFATRIKRYILLLVAVPCLLLPGMAGAQALTGALIGTVKDDQGGILQGAAVRVSSPGLIGGVETLTTNEKGQLRFLALPPGLYVLNIEMQGFTPLHEVNLRIGAGATVERTVVLKVAGVAESIVVEGVGSRMEARDPGFGTRFGPEDLKSIPTRRMSMFDFVRAAPGVSPTSPSSGTTTTVSAFGSGTNENQFLFDGTNVTCPCNGVARTEPGVDFIQEVQVQSVGASAEFGNVQGAVINVITRQGGDRFRYDASYYGQTARLTSRPVLLPLTEPGTGSSGYERARYRDFTTNLGGPLLRDRLWFFGGYQYLRDYDSQPGTNSTFPRTFEQDKVFGKLTWKFTPRLQLVQSVHNEFSVNPDRPTLVTPFEATARQHGSAPSMTLGHLTHTLSANTLWDLRVGRFVFSREDEPSTGDRSIPSRFDRVTGVTSNAPPRLGGLTIERTTSKATLSHYRPGFWGADHQLKVGGQVERGEHQSRAMIPTGVRYVDNNGQRAEAISSPPSNTGGGFVTEALFASDAITLGNRLTINAGVRFDHSRAFHQDLRTLDPQGRETNEIVLGRGTLYTWNLVSPRLGVTTKLTSDGRTVLFSLNNSHGAMIFFAKKCAISGLCTSASRVEDADGVQSSTQFHNCNFRTLLPSSLWRATADTSSFVVTAEVTHPEGSPAMVALTIRTMRPDEISIAVDWAAAEGWNPGLADAACFASADPEGFLIGELDGKPAAIVSCVNYGARFAFLGFYIVRRTCAAAAMACASGMRPSRTPARA